MSESPRFPKEILAGRRTFPVKPDIILLLGAGTKEMVPAPFPFCGQRQQSAFTCGGGVRNKY